MSNYLIEALLRGVKRRVFISYHHDSDQEYYAKFSSVFSAGYEAIQDESLLRLFDSDNPDYVIRRIREKHITGTSCTIVLCGPQTRWRKHVDWEIKATLDLAVNQEATRSWWETSRPNFELFISEIVVMEASGGDEEAAALRLGVLESLPVLDVSAPVEALAERLLAGAAVPEKAKTDALHIAVATVHSIDYLLTWNCKHIANAIMRPKIEAISKAAGYDPPIICTPLELMED